MFALFFAASLALAQDACPTGQVKSDFTQGNCCWPGQAWNGNACVGIPRCPEGLKTLPDRCVSTNATQKPKQAVAAVPTRNVMFAGGSYSGQVLFIDDEEAGKLPNAFLLPVGQHTWSVKNTRDELLIEGKMKVREGEGDQVVMVRKVE